MKSATRDIVKRYARVKHGYFNVTPISYPEPANFLRRMLDEKEGFWKGPVLIVSK